MPFRSLYLVTTTYRQAFFNYSYNQHNMSDKDIKQLVELAKKLKRELSRDKAMSSFVSAGILDSEGHFTAPYTGLKEAVSTVRP